VNRLRPAFVVVTGDLVNQPGDAAQIAEYKRIMGRVDAGIPVYHVAGNHDLGSVPTPQSVAAYTNAFGRDSYTFQHGDFAGVVLNSGLIHSPQKAPDLCAAKSAGSAPNSSASPTGTRGPWSCSSTTRGSSNPPMNRTNISTCRWRAGTNICRCSGRPE